MFTRRKTFVTSLIALCLAIISLVHFTLSNYSTPTAAVRTMELSQIAIDEQAILNEFDDAVIENEGSLTSFTGYKAIDATIFEEYDNISADDVDDFVGCRVKYDFSYDSETNIVTIAMRQGKDNTSMVVLPNIFMVFLPFILPLKFIALK